MMDRIRRIWPVILLAIFSLTPILWFIGKGGFLINGVDTNFPLNPEIWFTRRFFVWNNIFNGGIDFSSSISGLFFHLVQLIPFKMGLSLQNVQIISLVFWFSALVFSSYFLATLLFEENKLSRVIFSVIYSFNIYLFNSWENVKVSNLSLFVATPLLIGILILLYRKKLRFVSAFFYSLLGGIFLSGAGINPSYFLTFFLVLALFVLGELAVDYRDVKGLFYKIKGCLVIVAALILVNSFWILPTTRFILKSVPPSQSISEIGFTNWINSLSENTSLFNVLRLQGAWDWYATDQETGETLYIPYAHNYFKSLPFVAFSILLPGLAFLSLFFVESKKRNFYLSFSLMIVVGTFLGAGTHPPTGQLYLLILRFIPFFSLFRSPWYIFTILLIIGYAGLIGLFFDQFSKKFRRLAIFVAVVLLVGNLFYSYPLITGKIFRPERHDSFYVKFPAYVLEAADWLNKSGDKSGRIVGYPDDEIEQFSWGYRGIESILQLAADKETLFLSLNNPDIEIAKVIKEFYRALKKGQVETVYGLASKLGTGLLFEKKDQISLAPPLPGEISRLPSRNFGDWNFYDLSSILSGPKIDTAIKFYRGYPYDVGEKILSVLPQEGTLINPKDTVVNGIEEIVRGAGKVVFATNLQEKESQVFVTFESAARYERKDLSKVVYEFEIPEAGRYSPVLENYKLADFGLISQNDLPANLDGEDILLKLKEVGDYVIFEPLYFDNGKHRVTLTIQNKNLVNFDGGEVEVNSLGSEDVFKDYVVENFDPLLPYLIEVEYLRIYGADSQVAMTQTRGSTKIKFQAEAGFSYPEWNVLSFFYHPVESPSELKISLVSPKSKGPLGAKNHYRNLKVTKVFTNEMAFVKDPSEVLPKQEVFFTRKSPTLYEGEVKNVGGNHVILFRENYSSDWKFEVIGKRVNPPHFSANLYSNAWYLEEMPENYSFRIYYFPQRYFLWGGILSLLTFLTGFGLWVKQKLWKR